MKTSSCKNKARKLQKYVVSKILEKWPTLSERNVVSVPMGCKGDDVRLSEDAFQMFPYSVECKNTENLQLWKALEQAKSQSRKGTPILVFKRNRSEVYCALKFEDFMRLL